MNGLQKFKKTWRRMNVSLVEACAYLFGFAFTIVFAYVIDHYYRETRKTSGLKQDSVIFEALRLLDLKSSDLRFKLRGEQTPNAPFALIAIDDSSVKQIGRWPWNRAVIAQMIEQVMQNGGRAIGFDVIFSEPELSLNQPDPILANTIQKHQDKIVLGTFNEDDQTQFNPFQDYCRNEAFVRSGGDKIVKINPSFVVNDNSDPFEDIEFGKALNVLFHELDTAEEASLVRELGRKTLADLSDSEKRFLRLRQIEAYSSYCGRWFTEHDEFLQGENKSKIELFYLKLFSQNKYLKDLDFKNAIEKIRQMSIANPLPQNAIWTGNIPIIQDAALYTGSFNTNLDEDGTIRRVPLFYRSGNRIGTSFIPSLALQTYLIAFGYRAQIEVDLDPQRPGQKYIKSVAIYDPSQEPEKLITNVPVTNTGHLTIDFYGATTSIPYLPASELLNQSETVHILQRVQDPTTHRWEQKVFKVNKKEFINGKAFLVGATAIGIYDLRTTPFEKNFPGPETHLHAMSNIYEQKYIYTIADEQKYMFWGIIVLGIVATTILASVGALMGVTTITITFAGLMGFDYWLFQKQHTSVSMVFPIVLVIILYVITTLYKYLTEERKKQELRAVFSKYVSPAIVDEVLKDPDNINLGGMKTRMSVMFSDVRGFTTISEKLTPTQLSDVLNRYLSPMTRIVFEERGTLDKYIGDAVMAFFGAPIPSEVHAVDACKCALRMLVKLKDLQEEFAKENLPHIDIGIGINTGDMSVGNMGSDIVRSYTVMGDAVNLASRLEGITKEYGVRIVISEFTYADVKNQFCAREIDMVRVKGKTLPVRIYELIAEGRCPQERRLSHEFFIKGYELFHQRDFTEAKKCFQKASASFADDKVSKLYIERCNDYLENPPPENWDGVVTMTHK